MVHQRQLGLLAVLVPLACAQHGGHHSWDWFYGNMCGCTWTRYEGCGMSGKQLFQLITESVSVKLCEGTSNKGNVSKTADYLKQDTSKQDDIEARILKECQARVHLKEVAKPFEVCTTLADKAACDSKENLCEWEAQDEKRCGIDEEKLVIALVGENLKSHPLIENVIAQDKCSAKNSDACQTDAKCAWMHDKQICFANPALLFNAFMEHPGLFAVVDSQEQAAICSSFTDNVWHGEHCWAESCHFERGICMANKEMDVRNRTMVQQMKNHMCRDGRHGIGNSYTSEGEVKNCPPGCELDNKDGSCRATEIDASTPLVLTEQDKEVALHFKVLRSATYIQESRCNSLDDDEVQCKAVQSEHLYCEEGYYAPEKDWQDRQRRHNQGSDASAAVPAPAPQEIQQETTNVINHMAPADGGIGFQQKLGDLLQMVQSDQGGFISQFQSFITDKETPQELMALAQQAPQYVNGFRNIINSMAPETTPTPPPTPVPLVHKKDESSLGSSHMVMVCIACLLFAGVCGGFAWGVVCSNKMGQDSRTELLETQYIRQEEMMRQGRV